MVTLLAMVMLLDLSYRPVKVVTPRAGVVPRVEAHLVLPAPAVQLR